LSSVIIKGFKGDENIDQRHAKLTIEPAEYTIEDLNSKSGLFRLANDCTTLLKLKPYKSYDLGLGEEKILYFGSIKCIFKKKSLINQDDVQNRSTKEIESEIEVKTINEKSDNTGKKRIKMRYLPNSLEEDIEDTEFGHLN